MRRNSSEVPLKGQALTSHYLNLTVIRVDDVSGSVIEMHKHVGDFKSPSGLCYRWSDALDA